MQILTITARVPRDTRIEYVDGRLCLITDELRIVGLEEVEVVASATEVDDAIYRVVGGRLVTREAE